MKGEEIMNTLRLNPLPTPTWNWLHCNDTNVTVPAGLSEVEVQEVLPAEAETAKVAAADVPAVETSAGPAFDKYLAETGLSAEEVKIADKVLASQALNKKIAFNANAEAGRAVYRVGKGASLTIAHFFTAKDFDLAGEEGANPKARKFVSYDTRIIADEEAEVVLVDVIDMPGDVTFVDNIGGSAAKSANVKVIQVLLNGGNVLTGTALGLDGDKATVQIDTGYVVKNQENLDINYVIRHRGKYTDTKIAANGVLRDQATKTFRDTIDFIRGCKASTGDEREDVLLMNPGIVNKSVPLILCAEEDVEGTHGASIGKISDEELFYFESRGISEEDVQELMAKSRIDAVVGRIPDEAVRTELMQKLHPEEF